MYINESCQAKLENLIAILSFQDISNRIKRRMTMATLIIHSEGHIADSYYSADRSRVAAFQFARIANEDDYEINGNDLPEDN
jgi:hypothetical protein